MHRILFPNDENIRIAIEELESSELVSFPTETVYGLGGNALSNDAVSKIFLYKNRPEFNPLPICYPNLERAADDVFVPDLAFMLSEKFLPGPVTLLLKRRPDSQLSWLCSAGLDSICVRIPSHPVAQKLLTALSFPLAAPSANKSTQISPTSAEAVSEGLSDNNRLIILDDGRCPIGIESTIVDLTGENPRILRKGAITAEEISQKCNLRLEKNDNGNLPSSSLKHYSPKKKIILNTTEADSKDALLAFGVPFENFCNYVLNLSEKGDLNEAAANLFYMLRELDKTNASRICVMPIPNIGIGVAINDRLSKSAS